MFDRLAEHPFFTAWTDPKSGVISYVLTERVAPVQKAAYYTAPGISVDGQWLWFRAVFPPHPRARFLAAVHLDPSDPQIRLFHECHLGANPHVVSPGDTLYVPIRDGIYRFHVDGQMDEVFRLPSDVVRNRTIFRLCTTLTISADGRWFLLDSHIGDEYLIALVDVQTGEYRPLKTLNRNYHHAMFSPVDPQLFMMGQGPGYDPMTGVKTHIEQRMWIMDIDQTRFEPVQHDLWFNHNCMSCHEWWAPDGNVLWCDYDEGVYYADLETRERTLIWPHGMIHADCNSDATLFCGDMNPYKWTREKPCGVFFYDRTNQREVAIASGLPEPPLPRVDRRAYHLDPHPHFSPDDKAVMYTTSALGKVDVAVTPVQQPALQG